MTTTPTQTPGTGMTKPWEFGDPSGPGDLFNGRDHVGHLVAFVQPQREEANSKFGPSEVTRCRYVVCLAGGGEHPDGVVHDNPQVWGNLGENAFGNGDSLIVLGRIGTAEAKPGQSPAFILNPADADDRASAEAWFGANAAQNAAGNVVIG